MAAEPAAAADHGPLTQDVLQQAAQWFAVLADHRTTETERQRWQAWLEADAAHRRAWQRVESVSQRFAELQAGSPAAAHAALRRTPSRGRRQALRVLGGGGVALLGAWLLAREHLLDDRRLAALAAWTADERTTVGEVRELRLADGGSLWLNTASAADIDYGADLRRIALHAGELLVHTAPDPQQPPRPLVVDTLHGRLTALGTRFSVTLEDGATLVSVFDGAVDVAPRGGPAQVLGAGQQARFDRRTVHAPAVAARARESWSRGLLVAEDRRLDDFVAELARYVPLQLEVAPEVAALRLVGVYPMREPVHDFGRCIAALQAALPVRVHVIADRHWRIEAR
ncbi:FecR domain-containing protein [Pseudothauera rhizosphaerae]|uniref:DUF4880 domain-containing protein n=1 Tax=Pseudothauera rhizosphaerae TaxID=2565932 RepID=A0A4S4ACY4_9RHOO|nr:FecR domain-containing protein [Pseudothauera rhizosphaerae]THF56863.1 DUF4880 domain-containing protein [Pseudothauera rhizosphaerae]